MSAYTTAGSATDAGVGLLDRERIIAQPGFNRWLVPPAALAIHLCIGMAYGFSVFWLPLSQHLLFVSGRTSYEIVQKAFIAGIPLVAAVSAPSSLAVELAEDCGITLIGFLRGNNFNIYAHSERITSSPHA
jgi:hypothetical protein